MPRVSVIIPTYNRVDILPRAVDSVLAQTARDFELIVVDDGSTDDTQALLNAYDDPRIRSVAHGSNRGANVARNTGIGAATGTYVAFLDSDDEWHPRKLERQLAVLSERSDDWVAAYCASTIRTRGTLGHVEMLGARVLSIARPAGRREGGEELIGEVLADNIQPGAGSTLLVRTDVARQIGGFDESLDRFQDPEFVLRILAVGKLAYVDEPLVIRHDTGTPDAETIESADAQYLAMYDERVSELEERGYDIRGRHNLILAKAYLSQGHFRPGIRALIRATIGPRHYPGVVWAIGNGLRGRSHSLIILCILVVAGILGWLAFGA